jgi:hypothetical protein
VVAVPPDEKLSGPKKALFTAIMLIGLPLLTLAVVEGGVSLLLLASDLAQTPKLPPERKYTQYDRELGWVSKPDVHLRDMYGPGVWLRTNAEGFRATRSFTPEVPPGRVRVVCSGDSFTLGFGVSNDEAWCERLSAKHPRIEPVNMGQAGYGLGQAYLWYRRDGTTLRHDIHLFAFIWDDFNRMTRSEFHGYGKPAMVVRNGELVVENVPVPRSSYQIPGLTSWLKRSGQVVSSLRIMELARRARTSRLDAEAHTVTEAHGIWAVAEKLFDQLAEFHRSRGSTLILVHLPAPNDDKVAPARHWEAQLRAYAARTGVTYLDLSEDLQRLPADSLAEIFGPHRHYTPFGNEWVATRLYAYLGGVLGGT